MAKRKEDNGDHWERVRLRDRNIGKFILWAAVGLVGWSFISVQQHDTSIAVMEQRLQTIEEEISKLRGDYNIHRHNK